MLLYYNLIKIYLNRILINSHVVYSFQQNKIILKFKNLNYVVLTLLIGHFLE